MGKIAVELERAIARRREAGAPGGTAGTRLAAGPGWSADDVLCTYGPADRPFEERHGVVGIAVVIGGTFRYRTPSGDDVMTPGSLLLGNAGQPFECGHEHGAGDRCVSFRYEPWYFEQVLAAAVRARSSWFRVARLPPLRETAPLVARAAIGVAGGEPDWEELALETAVDALDLAAAQPGSRARLPLPHRAVARVTQSVRAIEQDPGARVGLPRLAADARLSPYHYLRMFRAVTGVTPHQFILRARLREAAGRLARKNTRIIDVALESGFNDISNFNRAFRSEFGVTPRAYRWRSG